MFGVSNIHGREGDGIKFSLVVLSDEYCKLCNMTVQVSILMSFSMLLDNCL